MNPNMLSFADALDTLLGRARPVLEVEMADTLAAAGRVLARSVHSPLSVPELDMSAMDGYAVRVEDVPHEGAVLRVTQRIPAGSVGHELEPGTAARIFTGAPLPPGANAVIMQELCDLDGEQVTLRHVPREGEFVRRAGGEIAAGSVVLEGGTRLGAAALGLVSSVGIAQLPVLRRVRVALFSTGSELVMPGEPLPPGGVYNSNRFQLCTLLEQMGCVVHDFGIVPDDFDLTRKTLREAAASNDLILTSGGVSVGEEDHVKPAVEAEGSIEMWKIAMKPGKPLAYGKVGGAAFIGVPGNPVSSFVTFLVMVRPFLLTLQGVQAVRPRAVQVRAAFDWPKPDRRREFLRARLDEAGEAVLFENQGSAALSSIAWAEGLVDIPAGTAVQRGETVRYLPYGELLY